MTGSSVGRCDYLQVGTCENRLGNAPSSFGWYGMACAGSICPRFSRRLVGAVVNNDVYQMAILRRASN